MGFRTIVAVKQTPLNTNSQQLRQKTGLKYLRFTNKVQKEVSWKANTNFLYATKEGDLNVKVNCQKSSLNHSGNFTSHQ